MKNTSKILLVLMALACLVLVSCPQPEQPGTWKEITTLKGLDGTWVGVSNVDLEEDVEDLEEFFGVGATATQSFSLTIKGDSYMVTESLSIDMTTVLENALKDNPDAAGLTTDDLWEEMKQYWETELEELDYEISFSSGRPYIMIFTDEPYTVSEEDLFYENEYGSSKWCVNNTKTKLKNINCYPAYDEETGEPLVNENGNPVMEIEEMIFVKQSEQPVQPEQPEQPEWTEIKTFKGLDGTWECTMEEEVEVEGIKIKASMIQRVKIDGEKVSSNLTQVVDYTSMIETMAEELEISADEFWAEFKDEFEEDEDWSFSYSEGKPYTITGDSDWEEVDEDQLFGDDVEVSVNNTKTKFKVIESVPMYDEETWEPVLDENGNPVMEIEEMIFVKK